MAENSPTVLVIEDEAQIRRFLRATLTANSYQRFCRKFHLGRLWGMISR